MHRSTLDKLISSTGLIVGVVLLAASAGLFYAHSFVRQEVRGQLAAQKITFPAAGSTALAALGPEDRAAVSKHAGQQVLTGAQAEVFADHYIAAHLQKIGGGQTYAELSAASMARPDDAKLAAQVSTVFKGETLRGMLLNAYAFGTMALVAYYAAWGALAAGLLLIVLAALGFYHSSRVKKPSRR